MSRSYKKNPVLKVYDKGAKTRANKSIRSHLHSIPKGGAYRKLYPTSSIYTQYYKESLFDVFERKSGILHPKYPKEDLLEYAMAANEWEKFYYRK